MLLNDPATRPRIRLELLRWRAIGLVLMFLVGSGRFATPAPPGKLVFPGKEWQTVPPQEVGADPEAVDRLSRELGGRGCLIQDGYLVKSWGNPEERSDWYSSVKPVFSTLLFFAIEEGRVDSVDEPIRRWGWDLHPRDEGITFRHLADMTSGYARPERPGQAWAYNDFAIQLYQKTLFDHVFQVDPNGILDGRLGVLLFQDRPRFNDRRRLIASPRDFARLGWFWINRGRWGDRQILPERYFGEYLKPDVPVNMPASAPAETDDYLGIGTFGGGSDHFTKYGAGIYGFNFWFNATGRLHPDQPTWPDAPADTIMTIGFGGNNMVMIPSRKVVLASARGDWGTLEAGEAHSVMNRRLARLVDALGPGAGD